VTETDPNPAALDGPGQLDLLRDRIREQQLLAKATREALGSERRAFEVRRDELQRQLAETRESARQRLAEKQSLNYLTPFRQMFTLAERCRTISDELAADVYVAHDDVALLAGHRLRDAKGGRLVYDAAEFPDRRERFGLYGENWPPPALDLFAMVVDPLTRSCDLALTGGDPASEYVQDTFGVRCHTIYNSRPEIWREADPEIRERCGLAPDDTLLLYVNTVSRASLFENLLLGLSELDDSHHLAVLGQVRPPRLKLELERLAADKGVEARLHWLGTVDWAEVPRVASGADAAIVAADPRLANCRTAVHNRYFDALSASLPILSSHNLGARKVFADTPFFFEFDLHDPGSFAKVVRNSDVRRIDRKLVLEFARKTAWPAEAPKLLEYFHSAASVTILAVKDVAHHHRTLRFAEVLAGAGKAVNVVCGRRENDDPAIANVRWFRTDGVL
jgi:glycosyltransferase involved in cell wall biosynthesis